MSKKRRIIALALAVLLTCLQAAAFAAGETLQYSLLISGKPQAAGNLLRVGVFAAGGTGDSYPVALLQTEVKFDPAKFDFVDGTVYLLGSDGAMKPASAGAATGSPIQYGCTSDGVVKLSYSEAAIASALTLPADALLISFSLSAKEGFTPLDDYTSCVTFVSGATSPLKAYSFDSASKPVKQASGTAVAGTPVTAVVAGDMDGNGNVTLNDFDKCVATIIGRNILSLKDMITADTTRDGCFNTNDLDKYVQYTIGKIVSYED